MDPNANLGATEEISSRAEFFVSFLLFPRSSVVLRDETNAALSNGALYEFSFQMACSILVLV